MKTAVLGAAALGLIAIAGAAGAQPQCNWVAPSERCAQKYPDNHIDNVDPETGGTMACPGLEPDTVQFDVFVQFSSGVGYACTYQQACSEVTDPEVKDAFC